MNTEPKSCPRPHHLLLEGETCPTCKVKATKKPKPKWIKYEIAFVIETDEENDFAVEEAITKALDEAIPCVGSDAEIKIEHHGSVVRVHDLFDIRAGRVS